MKTLDFTSVCNKVMFNRDFSFQVRGRSLLFSPLSLSTSVICMRIGYVFINIIQCHSEERRPGANERRYAVDIWYLHTVMGGKW